MTEKDLSQKPLSPAELNAFLISLLTSPEVDKLSAFNQERLKAFTLNLVGIETPYPVKPELQTHEEPVVKQ